MRCEFMKKKTVIFKTHGFGCYFMFQTINFRSEREVSREGVGQIVKTNYSHFPANFRRCLRCSHRLYKKGKKIEVQVV